MNFQNQSSVLNYNTLCYNTQTGFKMNTQVSIRNCSGDADGSASNAGLFTHMVCKPTE